MVFESLISLRTVQTVLPLLAFILAFVTMYCNANIILELYSERASVKRRLLFAFITGPVFSVLPMYLAYFLWGGVGLDPAVYLIFRNVNPIIALLYCFIGIKILHFSPVRSLRLMNLAFLILIVKKNLSMFIGSAFLGLSDSLHYDIHKDLILQCVMLVLSIVIYLTIMCMIRRGKSILRIPDSLLTNEKKETVIYILRSSSVYMLAVFCPLLMQEKSLAYFLVVLITGLAITICVLTDVKRVMMVEIENMSVHIGTFREGVEEFRGIKHDFYNILQTYGGYLAVGDLGALQKYHSKMVQMTTAAGNTLELSERMEQNPALFSLLASKAVYAKELGVRIGFAIPNETTHLSIEIIDLCRALACLLDNAIEAAAESEQKKVQFTMRLKSPASALIIVSNSTNGAVNTSEIMKMGVSSKEGHTGIGMSTVRKSLGKYSNCGFHVNYYGNEFNAYIELQTVARHRD